MMNLYILKTGRGDRVPVIIVKLVIRLTPSSVKVHHPGTSVLVTEHVLVSPSTANEAFWEFGPSF